MMNKVLCIETIFQSRKMISEYYKSEGLSPLRLSILPWTQLPLWFFLSLSLRNLAGFFPWQRNAGIANKQIFINALINLMLQRPLPGRSQCVLSFKMEVFKIKS